MSYILTVSLDLNLFSEGNCQSATIWSKLLIHSRCMQGMQMKS